MWERNSSPFTYEGVGKCTCGNPFILNLDGVSGQIHALDVLSLGKETQVGTGQKAQWAILDTLEKRQSVAPTGNESTMLVSSSP